MTSNSAESAIASKLCLADRYKDLTSSVWVEFVKLAVETKALNLGQGFPDFPPPAHVDAALRRVTESNYMLNQYTRSFGHQRLVEAISKVYSERLGHKINPLTEVLVSIGGYGSLYYITQSLLNPGDEAILIEPFYDCYDPMIRFASAVPKFVPLRPPTGTRPGDIVSSADWKWDEADLRAAFTPKTKAIIINTPNNPLGKVYSLEELQLVAELAKEHNVAVISDEVYEYLVYPPKKHIRIASLPGMWDRTISIYSAGKIFSVTGWKVGFAVGPAHFISSMATIHQNCIYTCPTPTQEAVAQAMEHEFMLEKTNPDQSYFNSLSRECKPKRDRLVRLVRELGMVPTVPDGGYFLLADFSHLDVTLDESAGPESNPFDYRFIYWMARNKGLTAIPPTAFYSGPNKHLAEKFIRLCFIKKDETLDAAEKILKGWHNDLESKKGKKKIFS